MFEIFQYQFMINDISDEKYANSIFSLSKMISIEAFI